MERSKRKSIIRITAIIIVLLMMTGSLFVWSNLGELQKSADSADLLLSEGHYKEAIEAYSQLLRKTPITFLGVDKRFPEIGARGVLAGIDALLLTENGAQVLSENAIIENIKSCIGHPAVPKALQIELERRFLLSGAILAEEQGDLDKAQSLLEQSALESKQYAGPSSVAEQQNYLREALSARAEGRLEEAIDLVARSGLRPRMIDRITRQIIDENDFVLTDHAMAALETLDREKAYTLLSGIRDVSHRAAVEIQLAAAWMNKLYELHAQYSGAVHAGAWYSLVLGEKPTLTGDQRYDDLKEAFSPDDTVISGYFSFIRLRDGHVELLGDTFGASQKAAAIHDAASASIGLNHALILHGNGTVTNLGAEQYGRGAVENWSGITEIAAGAFHSVGLTDQGTVAAAGLDADGQCQVDEWTDVISVAAGFRHTVALHRDGHVSATGDNQFGQCDVSEWKDVIAVSCGGNHTVALTSDFRLLATGDNACGQCDVSDWQEVIAVDAGLWHTVGLLSDGRIVSAGADGHGQGGVAGISLFDGHPNTDLPTGVRSLETEYLYMGSPTEGPWLYCNAEGCIVAAFDAAYESKPTRADLICTYGNPPIGILSGGGDRPRGTYPARMIARQNRAVFALTGDYFTFGYNADGLQIRHGTVFKEKKDEVGFAFFPDGSMRLVDPDVYTADDLLKQGIRDSWVFGPVLIQDGEILDISHHPLSFNDVTMRTVMATVCPYHHLAMAYGKSTLAQVTENLADYGVDFAYNLDGGRSSMMVFMDKIINRSIYLGEGWRNLDDMIGFLQSDLVPAW